MLIFQGISTKHRRADIHPFPHVNLTIGVVLQGFPCNFKEILCLFQTPDCTQHYIVLHNMLIEGLPWGRNLA